MSNHHGQIPHSGAIVRLAILLKIQLDVRSVRRNCYPQTFNKAVIVNLTKFSSLSTVYLEVVLDL